MPSPSGDYPGRVAGFPGRPGLPGPGPAAVPPSLDAFGDLDILVNNAGITIDSPLDLDDDRWLADWQDIMAVNLTACGVLCREAVRHFQGRGGGRIVNIASRAAFRGDVPAYLAYAASKGGMVSLTRSLARGLRQGRHPGLHHRPGLHAHAAWPSSSSTSHGEELVLKDIALDRLTEPGDIAPMVAFLASGLADHATGCTIDINAASYVH